MKKLIYILLFISGSLLAQQVPSKEENVDFLATFGKEANPSWGDDDHVQIYFFAVQKNNKSPFFIRVFDADCGGSNDQANAAYNTKTNFSIYGGKNCYSNKDARGTKATGKFNSGILLKTKTIGNEKELDNNWLTFGPFNPEEGEFDKELNSYVFKIIITGKEGDDGNMYRLFFSTNELVNKPVEGGNAFAYAISFRLINTYNETAHFYPFVDNNVVSITQFNFDLDSDGEVLLTTLLKKLHVQKISGDNEWMSSKSNLVKEELNTSLDIQIVKQKAKTNDATFYITNQYGVALPMFSIPIGGLPHYKYKIDIEYQFDKK